MKASETTLLPILEGTKQYVVPLFQRAYSWRKRHWQTLWDDLLGLYIDNDGRDHFMGAIVTMPVDMSPHGINKYLLIDGQQRLTTIYAILAAIRDLVEDTDPNFYAQINERYLFNKWEAGTNRYKLLPTQANRQSFYGLLEGHDCSDGEIADVYRFYSRKLRNGDDEKQPFDLGRFCNILVHQLAFVGIVLQRDENPYHIFESLNAKGEPLTQADLVRNYVLMRIQDEDDQSVAYRDYWRPMEDRLGKSLTDFMWRYLNKDGTFIRQNAIYDAFKSRLAAGESDKVIDELLDMHTYSSYYRRLIDPDQEADPEIRRRLKRLNRWEITTAYPFLLALYDDYESRRISVKEMCTAIETIESFVVRRFFCNVPTNALNRIFIALYSSLDPEHLLESMKAQLETRRWPTDEEFAAGWIKLPIYRSGTAKTRHVLESLETSLTDNNEPVDVTYPKITIEHVMPQTMNKAWEEMLGIDAASTQASYLHTIGNLTLSGQNEPMGNSPFPQKRQILAQSNFALNKHFSDLEVWDEGEIKHRATILAQVALQIWPGPASASGLGSKQHDPTGHKPTGFTLFGTHYDVKTWRDMLVRTCELLAQRHGDGFASKATQVRGTSRQYISYSLVGMVNPCPISGTGLFLETNLSARRILVVISQLLNTLGHSDKEFAAHW